MRILFVAPRFHTNQYQMVKSLLENKHEVIFHVASLGPTEDHSLLLPITFEQSKTSLVLEKAFGKGGIKRPYYFPKVAQYWQVFTNLKPDIVIIRDPYKYFSLLAAFYALFTNSRIIFYTQEELYRSRSRLTTIKQKLTIHFFKAAWMTPITGHQASENTSLKFMYYVPLPIPTKEGGQTNRNELEDELKILMIGKYHQERKKHLLLIEAIYNLAKKYKFKATFVGECATEAQITKYEVIAETIEKLGLSNIIELKKNVPFHKMEELYNTHNIFVLPAINEQYGVSTTEALAYGLPVICTDTCGARYNISNGVNGLVVKSDSLQDLTDALESLISNKAKVQEMSKESINYVHKNLSGSAFYERFSFLLKDRFQLRHFN